MQMLVVSDLHVEFHRDHGASLVDSLPEADIAVLAGDVGVYSHGSLEHVLELFSQKYSDVVFVAGNHEYYGSKAPETDKAITDLCLTYTNVHRLNHSSVTIQGQRFIGGTLWFREVPPALAMLKHSMNDFSVIKELEPWAYQQNEEDERHISHQASAGDIVVTHMIPSYDLVTRRWQGNSLNPFFVHQMPEEVLRMPKLWVYGHTHDSVDTTREGSDTRFLCNPFGYARIAENRNFNSNMIVEI